MENNNEFSYLNDLLLGRGVKHSEIIRLIQEAILNEFNLKYPGSPQNISVVVDEQTGEVRVMQDKTDITPQDFYSVASQIARNILIGKLKETDNMTPIKKLSPREITVRRWMADILFLGYNSLYFIYLITIFVNGYKENGTLEFLKGIGVLGYTFIGIALAIPILSVFLAVKAKINNDSGRISKLLFKYEIPLIFIVSLALGLSTGTPPIFLLILLITVLVVSSFALKFLDIPAFASWQNYFSNITHQSGLIFATYVALLYLFAFPLLVTGYTGLIASFFSGINFSDGFIWFFLYSLMAILLLVIGIFAVILMFSPFIISLILYKVFKESENSLIQKIGSKKVFIINAIVTTGLLVTVAILSFQPKPDISIKKLMELGTAQTYEEKESIAKELASKEDEIKDAFEKIIATKEKYIFTKSNINLREDYKSELSFGDGLAKGIENTFIALAYPFIYQQDVDKYYAEAPKYYDSLFAKPIYEVAARYRSSPPRNNINLVSRTVNINTDYQDVLATITVEEELKNTSWGDQEVVYEFSLPNDAVITDLKLGPNLEFNGVIAPRGAASKVYQQQLNVRRDPALLEQTGPRQYRLRVFPVSGTNTKLPNQKVQFTYIASITSRGYPLPSYSFKRNVNTENSKAYYFVNNSAISSDINAEFITASYPGDLCRIPGPIISRTSNDTIFASLIPLNNVPELAGVNFSCDNKTGLNLSKTITGTSIALLYDTSYENKDNRFFDDLREFMHANKSLIENNQIDYFLFNDDLSLSRRMDENWLNQPLDITYFGKSNMKKALDEFKGSYDLVIIAPGNGIPPIDIKNDKIGINQSTPVYVVYYDNKIPAYSNAFSDFILNSGGDVVSSFEEALTQYALATKLRLSGTLKFPTFGPYWAVSLAGPGIMTWQNFYSNPNPKLLDASWDNPLTYIVNKSYLTNIIKYSKGLDRNISTSTAFIDKLNIFAINSHIVSPYSSLIALVNQTQQAALENASNQTDRYSFESPAQPSSGGGGLPTPISPYRGSPVSLNTCSLLGVGCTNWTTFFDAGGGSRGGGALPTPMSPYSGSPASGGFGNSGLVIIIILGGGITSIALLVFMVNQIRRFIGNYRKK